MNDARFVASSSGLCFDFPIDNPTVYLAGTGDGLIHKCSCSYNEQYLKNFTGHNGPVYQLRCHPMHAPVFLTCSADWTIKLWSTEADEALLTFQQTNLTDAVNDVTWSPHDSTVFASVTSDGRTELWDLSINALQPQVRAGAESTSHSKRSAALSSGVSALSFWVCHGSESCADHIRRRASNSPERRPQLTLNAVCSVASSRSHISPRR